jgi:hypothetical protein
VLWPVGVLSGRMVRASQHGGGPTGGRGEVDGQRKGRGERLAGEFELGIHGPQDREPGVVDSRACVAWPVHDVQTGQFCQGDDLPAGRRVGRRDPRVGFEVSEAHDVQGGRQRLAGGREPAKASVGAMLPDERELGVEERLHPKDIHGCTGREFPEPGHGDSGDGFGHVGGDSHAQPGPPDAGCMAGQAQPVLDHRKQGP